MGTGRLRELFDEKYYTALEGGILESFGRLFKNGLKIYCYPLMDQKIGELTTCDNLKIGPELQSLYDYLLRRGGINNLDNFAPECLDIFSREVLRMIGDCDPTRDHSVLHSARCTFVSRDTDSVQDIDCRGRFQSTYTAARKFDAKISTSP